MGSMMGIVGNYSNWPSNWRFDIGCGNGHGDDAACGSRVRWVRGCPGVSWCVGHGLSVLVLLSSQSLET